jgi:beta-glucanase (GH16 family)
MAAAPSCASKTGYNLIFQDDFNSFNSSFWDKSSVGDDVGNYSEPEDLCDLTNNTPMNESNVITPPTGVILDLRVRDGEEMNACDYSGAEIKTFNNNGAGDSYRDWKMPPNSYIETRVKIPHCDGVGAAFWLYGGISNRYYEIDVFEYDSDEPGKIKSNVHYGLRGGGDTDNLQIKSACDLFGNEIEMGNQFLTFGVELTNSSIKMYLNDVIYQHYQYWPYAGSPLNSSLPFNIRLSCGENPHGTDPSDCEHLPQDFKIDYVRIYQKADSKAVKFVGDNLGKMTICVDNSCHGKNFCNWAKVSYYPGATYEWEPSPYLYLINESSTSEDLQQYSVWTQNGTLPGNYELKLKISFPCSGYQEDLTLNVTVIDDIPPAPYYISLFTDDDYHYYPGTTIADNTSSYEWCAFPVCKEVPNPTVGNKNIWGRYFRAWYEPREVTVCVRARNVCGFSSWFCQTLTVPPIEDPCSPCPKALLPPREVIMEQIPGSTSYRMKVAKSPYSQSYEWSLDEEYWHDVANTEVSLFNYFSPFEPGLDSFMVFVRARNQDTLSTIFSQKVATPGEPPLPKPVANTYPVVNFEQPSEIQERGEIFEQPADSFDSYVLYNMMGQVVRNNNWADFSLVTLRQELSPGIYVLVKFSADSANRNVTKLLITK